MGFENFPSNSKPKQEKSTQKESEKPEPVAVTQEELVKPETSSENPKIQEQEQEQEKEKEEGVAEEKEEEKKPRAEPSPEEIEKAKEQIIARMMQGASQFFDVISRRKLKTPDQKISYKEMEVLMDQTLFKANLSGFKKETSLYVKLYELDKLEDQQEFVKEFMKIKVVNDLMSFELASKTIEANLKLRLQEREQLKQEESEKETEKNNNENNTSPGSPQEQIKN